MIKMFAALHMVHIIVCMINNEKGLRCLLYSGYFSKLLSMLSTFFSIFAVFISPSDLEGSF